jgi:hypothetical protein
MTEGARLKLARYFSAEKLGLLCQLSGTALILGWVPGNVPKLLAMLVIWGVGFRRVTAAELLVMAGVNLFFAAMNSAALAKSIFRFDHPDFLAMPSYEYLMWGFYTLHTIRFLGGGPERDRPFVALLMAATFAAPFATIANPWLLLLVSGMTLAACFALFHELQDWVYAGYMAAVGSLIEHVGVCTGQWHYSDAHPGAVPSWSLTMWAGIGLFTRRLLVPLLRRISTKNSRSRG